MLCVCVSFFFRLSILLNDSDDEEDDIRTKSGRKKRRARVEEAEDIQMPAYPDALLASQFYQEEIQHMMNEDAKMHGRDFRELSEEQQHILSLRLANQIFGQLAPDFESKIKARGEDRSDEANIAMVKQASYRLGVYGLCSFSFLFFFLSLSAFCFVCVCL